MSNEIDVDAVQEKRAVIEDILDNGYYELVDPTDVQNENESAFAGALAALEWVLGETDGGFADLEGLIRVADTDLSTIRQINGL